MITVQFIPNQFLPGQFISKQFIPRQFIPWDSSYPEQFIPGTVHTWDSSYPGTVHTLRQFIPRKFIPGDEFSGYELSWVWIVLDMNCLRVWTVSGYELSQDMNCLPKSDQKLLKQHCLKEIVSILKMLKKYQCSNYLE